MFDPNPSEWLGLLIFVLSGLLAFFSFSVSAIAGKWRVLSDDGLLPASFYSILFSIFYLFSTLAISIGTWLVWADAVRCVDPMVAPRNSSLCPSSLLINVTMILYIIYFVLIVAFPPLRFAFPSWRLMPFILSFAVFGLAISLTIAVFDLWLLPGLLVFFGSLVLTLQFIWMYGYWQRSTILFRTKNNGSNTSIFRTPYHDSRRVGVKR